MDDDDTLDALLAQRREIDRALFEKHAVEAAVLFTDIVGSTAFYERRGDIEGLARVRRHNELLFPVVAGHGGRVVKTIGDAIMAVFPSATEAVACARRMHRALADHGDGDEPIRIRVGVHFGRVLKDGDDVFGDAVNTAARVQGAAGADEVLVSAAALAAAPGTPSRDARTIAAKGKSEPIAVATVPWRDVAGADGEDARGPRADAGAAGRELFVLEIGRGAAGLKVAALDGDAEKGTVKPYADVALRDDALDDLASAFGALARDGGDGAYASALRDTGAALFAQALSQRARERVVATKLTSMRLMLDDDLVHVPWELMHDGERHLGLRFSIGRLVAARAEASPARPEGRGEAVVVSNPSGDLPSAAAEGEAVARLLAGAFPGAVVHRAGPTTRAELRALLDDARLLHFAGHAVPGEPGGVRVADGIVTPTELASAFGASAPAFVFVNGCHASTARRWKDRAPSIAQALLSSGVRHALSPLWSIPDADALSFALRTYEALLEGASYGEAALRARRALVVEHRGAMSFAGYVLYGDPRARLPSSSTRTPAPRVRSGEATASPAPAAATTRGTTPTSSTAARTAPTGATRSPSRGRSSRAPLVVAVVVACAGVAGAVAFVASSPSSTSSSAPAPIAAATSTATPGGASSSPATPAGASSPSRAATGPMRLSVLPFGGADGELAFLRDGIAESVVTGLAAVDGVALVERGQIQVDVAELDFQQSKYVDPATRAAIGRIAGAEVVVLGSYQKAGAVLRVVARFVHVETGEILDTLKADGSAADPFAVQDDVAARVQRALPGVRARVRP